MGTLHHSFCRICSNSCAILAEVEDGRVVRVTGDPDNQLFHGYTCIKGRAQPDYLSHPERLLRSLKQQRDGTFVPIPVHQAMDDIAARLRDILDRYGPRAIAFYMGTGQIQTYPTQGLFARALIKAIGTPLTFDPNTIDKGGKQVAEALLGRWMAPSQGFDDPAVVLLLGTNPLVTYTGFPVGHPGRWLRETLDKGMQLIVIDPRRSDVAKRAALHLQPAPGTDAEILAAMIRVVLAEGLVDHSFVAENVSGIDALERSVAPFNPVEVARRADVPADDIVRAARIFAGARRGYAMAGTGPSMSGRSTLIEYLVLVLETLCGHWLREGEIVRAAPTLLPPQVFTAQARPPQPWSFGEIFRTRGLTQTPAGLPTSALPDEILLEGDRQVRALISSCGNPAVAFPDQLKTLEALRSLELLVQIDPWMSETARLAHYVIAPTMPLETASITQILDDVSMRSTGYGLGQSYAAYSPAIVDAPDDSDLIEEWQFFRGIALRMGVGDVVDNRSAPDAPAIKFADEYTTDELLQLLTVGSRIPLDEVKRHPGGACYPDPPTVVRPKEPGWQGRLDVANTEMLRDLAAIASVDDTPVDNEAALPFRLICRRHAHVFNSSCNFSATNHGRGYNPAFLHPADLRDLGLTAGDHVEIHSARAVIPAIVEGDDTLRRGLVSMMFGFGGAPDRDREVAQIGSSPNRLLDTGSMFDRFTGQPRMSNVPVRLEKAVGPVIPDPTGG